MLTNFHLTKNWGTFRPRIFFSHASWLMDARESFLEWKNDHNIQLAAAAKSQGNLDKPQTLIAATATLTSQFFYKHFLSVDSTPFDSNLFEG